MNDLVESGIVDYSVFCVETLNMRYFLPRKDLLNIVTWLILPVVICLSQRLSHACLSINSIP